MEGMLWDGSSGSSKEKNGKKENLSKTRWIRKGGDANGAVRSVMGSTKSNTYPQNLHWINNIWCKFSDSIVLVQSVDQMCWIFMTVVGVFRIHVTENWISTEGSHWVLSLRFRTAQVDVFPSWERATSGTRRSDVSANAHLEVSGSCCHGVPVLLCSRILW